MCTCTSVACSPTPAAAASWNPVRALAASGDGGRSRSAGSRMPGTRSCEGAAAVVGEPGDTVGDGSSNRAAVAIDSPALNRNGAGSSAVCGPRLDWSVPGVAAARAGGCPGSVRNATCGDGVSSPSAAVAAAPGGTGGGSESGTPGGWGGAAGGVADRAEGTPGSTSGVAGSASSTTSDAGSHGIGATERSRCALSLRVRSANRRSRPVMP
jgi:hypothetical protein